MARSPLKNLDVLFNPRSIALIGASNNPFKWGFIIPTNILTGQYSGKLFLVNPYEKKVLNREVYPSVNAISEDIDVAVVVTPSSTVASVTEECARKGVKAEIVITAGFGETGAEGAKLEKEVVSIASRAGIALVGPNTMGVYSSEVSLYALMPPVRPKPGAVALVSQSGNLGTQLLDMGEQVGLGFTKFASSGNEAAIRTEDYIEYYGKDPDTRVIIAYIEGLKGTDGGTRFMEVAREITKKKPIIVFKAGRSEAGAKAAMSHSGAIAGSRQIYEDAFRQLGIIQASTIEQLLDLAKAFEGSPLPKGKRVGILTWGGGYGVVTADACEEAGLEVARLSPALISELDKVLPPYWSKGNPVDLVGTLDGKAHLKCLNLLAGSDDVDATIVLGLVAGASRFVEIMITSPGLPDIKGASAFGKMFEKGDEDIINEISRLVVLYDKPVVTVTLTSVKSEVNEAMMRKKNILAYSTPERAAKALSKLYEYQRYLYNAQGNKGRPILSEPPHKTQNAAETKTRSKSQ
jgi:acyl-CoA synthetase (NDP forming)